MMSLYQKSKKPGEYFLLTSWLSRPAAYPLARLCHRLGISANAVTVLGGVAWLVSVPLIVLAGVAFGRGEASSGWTLALVSAGLWNVGYLLDVVDGSLARMNGTQGAAGSYLDFCFHVLFQPMFFSSIGVLLYLGTGETLYLIGALLSIAGNWPASQTAREHILCERIASGDCQPGLFTYSERREHFLDTPWTKRAQAVQRAPLSATALRLFKEILLFPGQFTLMGAAIVVDFALSFGVVDVLLPVTRAIFLTGGSLLVASIPFRMRREFVRMQALSELEERSRRRSENDGE